jgi:glycosyltransferase involved in cell wall biosynthesis
MPEVSIIIPAYNAGDLLRQALISVHEQTFDDWELVVVDDASQESPADVLKDFPRARYIRQTRGGVSVARNHGLFHTSGQYVCFMDQDDLWRSGKLHHQIHAMNLYPQAAVCYCDLKVFHGMLPPNLGDPPNSDPTLEHKVDSACSPVSRLVASVKFFSERFTVPSTTMLRRDCLHRSGILDPMIPFSGDFDLLIKLGQHYDVVHVPAIDVLYRKHASNFSDRYEVGRQETASLIARYSAYAEAQGEPGMRHVFRALLTRPRSIYAAQAFDRARYSLRQKDYRSTAYHLVRSLMFNPRIASSGLIQFIMAAYRRRVQKNAASS